MRLFIGVQLDGAVVRELSALCVRLRPGTDGLRWSAPESWHITLQFLGSTTEEQYACVAARLSEIRSAPVPIRLGGVGIFERAGIFHVGVEPTDGLVALKQQVTARTGPCGFEPEDRPYRPHITLARTKGDAGRRQLKQLKERLKVQPQFKEFTAREFLLYESHLGAGGSKYEVRARFGLGDSASRQVSGVSG
jgi:RNA 2',3'-cyclic 3'-phosphodiesterase